MSFDPLNEIRQEFSRLGWSDHDKRAFIASLFSVDNEGLLFLDERQRLLAVLKTLKVSLR